MCTKEAREFLGRFLKRFLLKYKSTIAINDSSLFQSKDVKTYFYYGFFPVIIIVVCLITGFDIYFYWKYHYTSSYSDKKFLYLFPIPCVAPSFFVVNAVMSVGTTIRLKVKQCCEFFLTLFTLVSLFGIVYLFYHGFWIIIALLVYPGRILIGGIFIVPLILAIIPTWITAIKMAKNFFDAYNESSSKCESFYKGCAWLALFFYELVFWGLFIFVLYFTSRFLLGSIDTKNETVKVVLSYLIISIASIILVWLNTDLVINKQENPGGQQRQNDQENQNRQERRYTV